MPPTRAPATGGAPPTSRNEPDAEAAPADTVGTTLRVAHTDVEKTLRVSCKGTGPSDTEEDRPDTTTVHHDHATRAAAESGVNPAGPLKPDCWLEQTGAPDKVRSTEQLDISTEVKGEFVHDEVDGVNGNGVHDEPKKTLHLSKCIIEKRSGQEVTEDR